MTYAIRCTPNYYAGTIGAPQESLLKWCDLGCNDYWDTDTAEFSSKDAAQEAIDNLERRGPYYLSHGEAGRPGYEIVDMDNDPVGGDDCYDAAKLLDNNYMTDMRMIDQDNLPAGVKAQLDGLNVEYESSGDDHDIYSKTCKIDGVNYGIAYCPKTVALQLADGDLSRVDWDNQAYFTA